jgi:hypothetical protein
MYPKAIHKPKSNVLLPAIEQFTSSIKSRVFTKSEDKTDDKVTVNNNVNTLSENAKLILTALSEQGYEPFYSHEIIEKTGMDAGKNTFVQLYGLEQCDIMVKEPHRSTYLKSTTLYKQII